MKKVGVIGTLLLAGSLGLALPLASQAHSQADGGRHAMHGKHRFHHGGERHFMGKLNLTEAQRDQIFKLRHEAAPTLREKGKQARAARTELRQLAQADRFDEAKARALSQKVANAQTDFMVERMRLKHQILAVLTPEQRQKAEEARKRFGERHGHGEREPAQRS